MKESLFSMYKVCHCLEFVFYEVYRRWLNYSYELERCECSTLHICSADHCNFSSYFRAMT